MRRASQWGCLLLFACMECDAASEAQHAASPGRIVSLGPSLTKQLYLLGATAETVGITTYCPQPSGLPAIARAGSVVEPNVEQIVRLRPDLVLATSLTSRKAVATLQAVGLSVVEFPPAKTFDEICGQFLMLGARIGRQEKARHVVEETQAQVNALREAVPPNERPSVFIQIGARPLCTAGKDSFLNDLVEMAGGVNIARDVTVVTYSRESVLAANPDCILVVTMGMTGPDEIQTWRRYETLTAAKHGRIHMIESELVCSPTPVSFVDALATIVKLLHPEQRSVVSSGGPVGGGRCDAR